MAPSGTHYKLFRQLKLLLTFALVALLMYIIYLFLWPRYPKLMKEVSVKLQPLGTKDECTWNRSNGFITWEDRNKLNGGSVDILNLERPQYLENFKNPCWREKIRGNTKIRCFPYFLIIGMPKCGTSDLWLRIGRHPLVSTKKQRKELHWWTIQRHIDPDQHSIDSYIDRFHLTAMDIMRHPEPDGSHFYPMVTGEGSPDTLWKNLHWRKIPQNCPTESEPRVVHAHEVKHLLPNAKIILTLRDPVEQLFAIYLYFQSKEEKSPELFHELCMKEIRDWNRCIDKHSWRECAYNNSDPQRRFRLTFHVVYVKDWLEVFPRDQIHIVQLEEYAKDRSTVLKGIFNFLDLGALPNIYPIANLPVKNPRRRNKDMKMTEATRSLLRDFYRPYSEALSEFLKDKKWLYS